MFAEVLKHCWSNCKKTYKVHLFPRTNFLKNFLWTQKTQIGQPSTNFFPKSPKISSQLPKRSSNLPIFHKYLPRKFLSTHKNRFKNPAENLQPKCRKSFSQDWKIILKSKLFNYICYLKTFLWTFRMQFWKP